jgi:hypothetical protein
MDCKDCADLEQAFLEIRRRSLSEPRDGTLTPEKVDELSREEWKLLLALSDHRATQQCLSTIADATSRSLPAPRNSGGIISPS